MIGWPPLSGAAQERFSEVSVLELIVNEVGALARVAGVTMTDCDAPSSVLKGITRM